jgi:hypothetical protein
VFGGVFALGAFLGVKAWGREIGEKMESLEFWVWGLKIRQNKERELGFGVYKK